MRVEGASPTGGVPGALVMDWFIARNGKPVGPLTGDALVEAAQRGQLSQDDYVWQPGGDTWVRAADLLALWAAPTGPPAHVPKKRAPWFGPALVGLAVSGTALLIFFTSLSRIDADGHARPIKRDCAFNDYLQGRCR